MRVAAHRLTAGIVFAGLGAATLSPAPALAKAPAAPAASSRQASSSVVPDRAPVAPAPATTTAQPPIDPQAPLVLTEPEQPHAIEDPAETAKTPKTPSKPKPAKPAAEETPDAPATTEPGATAPPASGPDEAALAAIPAVPRAGVPSYFIDSFRIPVFLLPILQAAGTEYGVRWEILAAINEIETDYGRNLNVSSAGATGWMQFMPATWAAYGLDANRDGSADPYNPVDAIFAAARYLQAAGAQTDLRRAIFAYNHADWYVTSVLQRAQRLAALPGDLVGALTGLASGRSPVLGQARVLAPLAEDRRSLRLSVRDGARIVAATDARVIRIGRSARLGRYVRLRDVFGNVYTYGRLSRLEQRFPVLRPAPRGTVAPAPAKLEQDPAPSAPATAGAQPAAPAVARQPRASAAPAAAPVSRREASPASRRPAAAAPRPTTEAAPTTRPPATPAAPRPTTEAAPTTRPPATPAAPRPTAEAAPTTRPPATPAAPRSIGEAAALALAPLIADPGLGDRLAAQHRAPIARVAGPLATLDWGARAARLGIGLPAAAPPRPAPKKPPPAPASMYDRRLLGDVPAARVTYRPLREGSRVVAGTIIGRAERPTGRRARVRFEITPAGRRSARIDPAPIVAGWKLLQASSAGAASLGVTGQPSIGQVMLLGKQALERLVLGNPRIGLYPCGGEDVRAGRIDRRILATLQLLAMSGLSPSVSSLQCGHGRLTASGNVSEHSSGNAVDIAAINGTPILGNQGAGSITDLTIGRLLTLQGPMQPHQIISLMTYAEASNTMALPDHADHIHVGFSPQSMPGSPAARLLDGVLEPKAWQRLVDRLARIHNPRVAAAPSAAAILAAPPRHP